MFRIIALFTLLALVAFGPRMARGQDASWLLNASRNIQPLVKAPKPKIMRAGRFTDLMKMNIDREGLAISATVTKRSGELALAG